MKKIMFAAAVAAAGLAFGIESANTVGYLSSSNPAPKSYVMVANSFQDCGETSLDLNRITTTATAGAYDTASASAPMLKIWDPAAGNGIGAYYSYFYITDAYDEKTDDDVIAWADKNGDCVANINLPLGSALWYICQAETGKAVTFSGEVSPEDDLTVSATTVGYTMVANPFPVATDLNKVQWFGVDGVTPLSPATYDTMTTSAPTIKVWDAAAGNGIGAYLTYYYISDAYDEAEDDDVTAWADKNGDVATDIIPAGQGFWLILPTGHTGVKATFTK